MSLKTNTLFHTQSSTCFVTYYNLIHPFTFSGDRLDDTEMNEILQFTETEEDLDGNIKYGGM